MNKNIYYYLCPTIAQITIVSLITFILRKNGYVCGYDSIFGIILIIAAGISSALWGCAFQIRYNGKNIKTIFKDFFHFKADYKSYMLVVIFIILDFFDVLFGGSLQITKGCTVLFLFIKSIAFGGIEEIGWRYTFQPYIERRLPYSVAAITTFIFWGVWHFLFFYIDGSISDVQVFPFLSGLLTNCFMLSAIYNYKHNLWLCVLAHSLVNTFSQVVIEGNIYIGFFVKFIIISLSILLSRRSRFEK
ncbi:MAG: CPBP family intramembrane metalloprotease [Oscillospiraceae bacterium]|nr:CPBP family intramembrane metalloprotease [Oscillospiraceae bacterium]